ncbi:uncharacterized protein LOC135950579 [Calliphora vicina]|uniref:uncharacterized protein LOC135950579 n=1 Tax=Calliphora vicina TaxID=7373 RepID=UPI00325BC264
MDLRPNRQKIVDALIASGIQFPESATMSQLRSLYDSLNMNETRNNEPIPCDVMIASPETLDLTSDSSIAVLTSENSITTSAAVYTSSVTTSVTTSASFTTVTNSARPSDITSASFTYANPIIISARMPDTIFGAASPSAVALTDATSIVNNGLPRFSNMHRINYDELDKMVPKFDGDIVKWFRKLEEYTYNYNDEERLLCLKWLLQGTAREFMENSNNWTYGDLKVSLFKIFRRDITREDVYRKLRTRTLKPSESCISYTISMQTIASLAEIEGQELVDIIIDGMKDNSNNISLLYGCIYKNCPNRQPVSASIFPKTIVNTNDVVDPMKVLWHIT